MHTKPPKSAKSESAETENGFGGFGQGLVVPEGKYTVKVKKGDKDYAGAITLQHHPSSPFPATERVANYKAAKTLYDLQERLAYVIETTVRTRDTLETRLKSASDDATKKSIEATHKQFADFYKTLVAGEGFYVGVKENKIREKLLEVYGLVLISGSAPSKQHAEQIALIEKDVNGAVATWEKLTGNALPSANEILKTKGLPVVPMISRQEFFAMPQE
jgi:hypothetical protein